MNVKQVIRIRTIENEEGQKKVEILIRGSVEQLTTKLNDQNRGILLEIMSESGRREYVGFGL